MTYVPSTCSSTSLLVCGVPQNLSLIKIGEILESTLGIENAITSISWGKPLTQTNKVQNVVIKLRNDEDVQWLLGKSTLRMCIQRKEYSLKVTKLRVRSNKPYTRDPSTSTGGQYVTEDGSSGKPDYPETNAIDDEEISDIEFEEPNVSNMLNSTHAKEKQNDFHNATVNVDTAKSSARFNLDDYQLQINLPNNCKILEYLHQSKELQEQLQHFCKADFMLKIGKLVSGVYPIIFKPYLTEVLNQEEFNSHCEEVLTSYISFFSSEVLQNSPEVLKPFKDEHQLMDTGLWNVDGESAKLFFEWNIKDSTSTAHVTVTGRSTAVESFKKSLEEFASHYESKRKQFEESSAASNLSVNSNVLDINDIHTVHNWNQLYEKDPELFTKFNLSCILARNLPSSCSFEEARLFFEGNANQAKVKRIRRTYDGHLVAFEDKKSAENILYLDELCFQGVELTLLPKQVPPLDPTLAYVKGRKISSDDVESIFLKCSSIKSTFETHQIGSKRVLVIFEDATTTDLSTLNKEIQDLDMKKNAPKVMPLCRSDCIISTNLEGIDFDPLKLQLKKKKYEFTCFVKSDSNGKSDSTFFIFLSDYKDVPKLLDDKLQIGDKALEMSYYLPDIGKFSDAQYQACVRAMRREPKATVKFQPQPFQCNITANPVVIELVVYVKSLVEDLNEELLGLARVTIKPTSVADHRPTLEASFTPVATLRGSFGGQKSYEKQCIGRVDNYTKQFVTQTITNLSPDAEEKLKAISFDRNANISVIEKEGACALIKWQEHSAEITGKPVHIQNVTTLHQQRHQVFQSTEFEFKVYHDCGIIDSVEKEFMVKITRCNNNSFNMFIEGTKTDVSTAMEMLKRQLKEMYEETDFGFLEFSQKDLIKDPARWFAIEKKIRELFADQRMKASLQLRQVLTLICKPQNIAECKRILRECIKQKQVARKEEFDEITKDPGWEEVDRFLRGSELVKLLEKDNSILLVGFSPPFDQAMKHFDALLRQTDEGLTMVKMGEAQTLFFSLFLKDLDERHYLANIDYCAERSGIRLNGKLRSLNQAKDWIKRKSSDLKVTSHTFDELWHEKYLTSEEGKQLVTALQSRFQCAIVVRRAEKGSKNVGEEITYEVPAFEQTSHSARSFQQHQQFPAVDLPGTNIKISVVNDNIICHQVDAIVNASNNELELRSAGISGSIQREGGYKIQQEMNAIRYGLPKTRLETGSAVTTSAGRLGNCKKIIHVAGPVWYNLNHQQASWKLMEGVRSCLIEAEKYGLQSIAIPAISCGVFGGQPDGSAKLIIEEIVDYFRSNKGSSIKRVDLIEMSNKDVIKAFSKHLNALASSSGKGMQKIGSSRYNPTVDPHESKGFQNRAREGFRVVVERGNALLSSADVLINTAGPNFDLNRKPILYLTLDIYNGQDGAMNYLNLTLVGHKHAMIARSGRNWGRPFSCSGVSQADDDDDDL